MKKQLSQGAIIGSLVALVVAIAVAAVIFFKPSMGAGPVVQPRKFDPGAYGAASGSKQAGNPGNPSGGSPK